jgi:short-subunit dehydrogenase
MLTKGAILITGASSGVGEACAIHLDRLGFRVFAGVLTEAESEALQQKTSDRLTPVILDITKEECIASTAEIVTNAIGSQPLAGLINNAGIALLGPLEVSRISDIRNQLEVNVIGQVAVTQAFLPLLRKSRGRIINIGSICGMMPSPFYGVYPASKSALESITDSLRLELQPWDIKVSLIQLGPVESAIFDKMLVAADELEKSLPRDRSNLYQDAFAALHKWLANGGKEGLPRISTDIAVKIITEALTAKNPKSRYFVASNFVKLWALIRFLPDRMFDALLMNMMQQSGIHKNKVAPIERTTNQLEEVKS